MSIPLLRESYHIKQQKMKSFQLNPISSRSEDDTKHAEQAHSPENSLEVILQNHVKEFNEQKEGNNVRIILPT